MPLAHWLQLGEPHSGVDTSAHEKSFKVRLSGRRPARSLAVDTPCAGMTSARRTNARPCPDRAAAPAVRHLNQDAFNASDRPCRSATRIPFPITARIQDDWWSRMAILKEHIRLL